MIKKVSIIIPCFNEEENIPLLYKRIIKLLSISKFNLEIIFVNDGSRDSTQKVLDNLANMDKRVKYIEFTRNFGHQSALLAGFNKTKGDIIITMDCDLQDPPELILQMIKKWEEGYNIVYARRIGRHDGILKKLTAKAYYTLLDKNSQFSIPKDVGDFRLIDKKVLNIIRSMNEKSIYLRGMIAWTGFSYTFVDYDRPNRSFGKTNYTLKKMFNLAMNGFFNLSSFPIIISNFLFIFSAFFSSLLILNIILINILKIKIDNYSYHIAGVLLLNIVGIFLLWILIQYSSRIYEEEKNRPSYVILNSNIN